MELAVPKKKEVKKLEKTELYNVVSDTWTAGDLTFARSVDPTWFTLDACLRTYQPSYIVPLYIADRLDVIYYLSGLFFMLYHGNVPHNWPADRGKVFVVVLRSIAEFEEGDLLFDCDVLPEYRTILTEKRKDKKKKPSEKKKPEEQSALTRLKFPWPNLNELRPDDDDDDDGDNGEAAALLQDIAEIDERDGLRAIRVTLQAARDTMRAGLAGRMAELQAERGEEPSPQEVAIELLLSRTGKESAGVVCRSHGDNKEQMVPTLENFGENLWEFGTERKLALLFLYFLRVGVKRSSLLMNHAKTHWKKTLVGWAELTGDLLPAPPPEENLSALEKGIGQLVPSIALHAVTSFIQHPEKYAEMKKWFCSRYEFFGQSFIGMYKTIATVAELKSALLEMASPWNQALLAKNLYTYAVYACYSHPVAASLSESYLDKKPISVNSMKAGRFARCFSSAYMPWTTFFNEPRLSNLLLGISVSLMRNPRSVTTDISTTNEYKIGQQYGKLLAQGASAASRPYGDAMRAIYDEVYTTDQSVAIEDITGQQPPPDDQTGAGPSQVQPQPFISPPLPPVRRKKGNFSDF